MPQKNKASQWLVNFAESNPYYSENWLFTRKLEKGGILMK